jgi:hypothetical protein
VTCALSVIDNHLIDNSPTFCGRSSNRREDRICAHVQLRWLALLLARVAEVGADDTWRNLRNELERLAAPAMRARKRCRR